MLKSRDITLPTKACGVKAMVFSGSHVWIWELNNWKTEHWRTDAFKLWGWRKLLRLFWTARRSNQSILKEISPEYSLEWLMMKLILQYFSHLMQRTDSFEKTLMLRKIEGRRRSGRQRMRWLDGITDSVEMNLSKLLVFCSLWCHKELDTTEWLNWTELINLCKKIYTHFSDARL